MRAQTDAAPEDTVERIPPPGPSSGETISNAQLASWSPIAMTFIAIDFAPEEAALGEVCFGWLTQEAGHLQFKVTGTCSLRQESYCKTIDNYIYSAEWFSKGNARGSVFITDDDEVKQNLVFSRAVLPLQVLESRPNYTAPAPACRLHPRKEDASHCPHNRVLEMMRQYVKHRFVRRNRNINT